MFKLLIAEDVRIVREALIGSIPWESLGIKLLAAVEDGEQALAWLERDPPDLLLTDIGMPKVGGLELIEAFAARKPDIRCVILSGLNEFEYARQAIKLRVREYILKPIDPEEIARVFAKVTGEMREERAGGAGRSVREALPNLAEALPPGEWSGSLKKKKLVEQALRFVKENFDRRELALSEVAEAVGFSEKYLNLLFREVTGETINQAVVRLRMEEAARLLKDPANRIYEICDRIGYADQDHFREMFKKQFGLTPTEYRNQYV